MIAPGKKLLFWFGITAPPLAALAGLIPGAAILAYGILALLLLAAAVDAAAALNILDGMDVSLPGMIRATAGRRVEAPVTLRDSRKRGLELRLGAAFPRALAPDAPEMTVRLPRGVDNSVVQWGLTAARTGRHPIRAVHVEALSWLGLWRVRTRIPTSSKVCVFPNLIQEKVGLAALFLRSSLGGHVQRQVGKGRDFDQLREYIPGDSFGDIHWKATAKRGSPITKVHQIERTQEVYVILDASRLSARSVDRLSPGHDNGGESVTVLERFVAAALVLGLAAQRHGDMFGMAAFTDKVDSFIRARSGKVQYGACRDALYTMEPRVVSPDFAELFSFLGARLRRRALLLFLTNLDDAVLAEDFMRHMKVLSGRHLLMVNTPAMEGVRPLFSACGVHGADQIHQHMAGHLMWEKMRKIQRELNRKGVGFHELDNEKMAAQLVSQYVNIKQRQIL